MLEDNKLLKFYLKLTARQREVVGLVSRGMSTQQVASKLYIQPSVVARHLTNIYDELATVEGIEAHPNRHVLISLFAAFFDRHPELREQE